MNNMFFFGQVGLGNEISSSILNRSLDFFQATGEAWDRNWDLIVNSTQPMWVAAISIGEFFFGLSLFFYLFIRISRVGFVASTKEIYDQAPLPLTVSFLFAGNGQLLSLLILGLRAIFQSFMVLILQIQVAGISINNVLQDIQNTAITNNRAREIFSDCLTQTGLQLEECVNDPAKLEQAQDLVSRSDGLLNGNVLEGILELVGHAATFVPDQYFNAISNIFGTIWLSVLQLILLVLQYCFIQAMEAVTLLTAISGPIFLGFSLFTVEAPIIILWIASLMGLYFGQLGYIALISLYALVVSQLNNAGVPIGTMISDLVFLTFISVFAPIIAVLISIGGGIKLYEQISNKVTTLVTLLVAT